MTKRLVTAALAVLVSACAMQAGQDSPFYDAGFGDGCATANAEAAPIPRPARRDETLYAKDSGYRAGWISGHAACRKDAGPPRL